MKKVIFGFFILLLLSALALPISSSAQVSKISPVEALPSVTITADDISNNNDVQASTEAAKVDYILPFPGILPDNPLYFLKAIRDRIVGFLISDSQKKAEFDLLTSDKRINAALTLAMRGKDEIAMSTLSKSNNYMDLVIASLRKSQASGKNIDTVLHNLRNSIKKHQEVVLDIKKDIDPKYSSQAQKEQSRLMDFDKSVENLILE